MSAKRKHFTTTEMKFIKENKENMTYKAMAMQLGHTKGSIGKFSRRYAGLRNKSPKKYRVDVSEF